MEDPIFSRVPKTAAMNRKAYAKTAKAVVAEFDARVSTEKDASAFVEELYAYWEFQPGRGGLDRWAVDIPSWDIVMSHIRAKYPSVVAPDWKGSAAYRAAVSNKYSKPPAGWIK